MQRECARYVNTLFAPQLANPSSTLSPWHSGMPTRPDNAGTVAGGSSVAITGPHDTASLDPDEVWPPVGDAADTDTTDEDDNADPTNPAKDPARRQSRAAVVDGVAIVELYANLKQGQSVKQWYAQHSDRLAYIDIRRFITFGIIKGFLYRVHKYAYATGFPKHHKNHHHHHHHHRQNSISNGYFYDQYYPGMTSGLSSRGPGTGANSPYASSAGDSQGHHHHHYYNDQGTSAQTESTNTVTATSVDHHEHDHDHEHDRDHEHDHDHDHDVVREEEEFIDNRGLVKYLDGMHCFDQICTELEVSERALMARLRRYPGEVMVIHR